ncbi:hypothetical protein V6N13_073264 [Hibiscus sabdariffa]|uniref:Uncharacterized protein n=1 Tax=Hibiscus sabdariffa TaxID=183260 RepID=A0ABR2EA64_9ROSI
MNPKSSISKAHVLAKKSLAITAAPSLPQCHALVTVIVSRRAIALNHSSSISQTTHALDCSKHTVVVVLDNYNLNIAQPFGVNTLENHMLILVE